MITQQSTPTARIYAYARASTSAQVLSTRIQSERLREKAREIEATGAEWSVCRADKACSGTSTRWNDAKRRPELAKLRQEIEPGDHLIIWRLDRLERRALPLLEALEWFVNRGVQIHVLEFQGMTLDLDTPMGRLLVTIMAGMAAFFVDQTREAVIEQNKWRRAHGLAVNNTPPIGKQRRRKLVQRQGKRKILKTDVWHTPTCDLIREIWRRKERENQTLWKIARDFEARQEVQANGEPWVIPRKTKNNWLDYKAIHRVYWRYCVMLALGRDLEEREPRKKDVERARWVLRDFRLRKGHLPSELRAIPDFKALEAILRASSSATPEVSEPG